MILLYHLVFPDATPKDAWNAGLVLRFTDFKRQLLWLKRHFQFVSLDDYLDGLAQDPKFIRTHFSLTFDDGYRQVFDLISPFLIEENIPATFFVTTSQLEDGHMLWFAYFNALCSEKVYESIEIDGKTYPLTGSKLRLTAWQKLVDLARQSRNPTVFARFFVGKYPLPDDVAKKYEGISHAQIVSIGKSDLFEVGGHTHSHPYLDQLPVEEQLSQIQRNKMTLQQISGKSVSYFAYTGGIYNTGSISAVKDADCKAAFAITPRNLGPDWRFELPRVDIYSPSLFKFKIKALGIEKIVRRLLRKGGSG